MGKIINRPRSVLLATAALIVTTVAMPANADPATHEVSIRAESGKTDCTSGGTDCADYCQIRATVKNLTGLASEAMSLTFFYFDQHVEPPEGGPGVSAVSLSIDALPPGASVETKNEAYGYDCQHLKLKSVEVSCPEAADERCGAFFIIKLPDLPEIGLKAQKVDSR